MIKRLWCIPFLALGACSEPSFYFRGYSNHSGCGGVIDAELANGAIFEDAYDDLLSEGTGLVTELTGEIFETPVRIDVGCYRDSIVGFVSYVSLQENADASDEIHERFSQVLDDAFGVAEERSTADGRSKIYYCTEDAKVVLAEAVLAETEYEVSLVVVPYPRDCD